MTAVPTSSCYSLKRICARASLVVFLSGSLLVSSGWVSAGPSLRIGTTAPEALINTVHDANDKVSGLPSGIKSKQNGNSAVAVALTGTPTPAGSANFAANSIGGMLDSAAALNLLGPTNLSVVTVAAGHSHTCAVVDGGVQCWGYNFYGQLGNGTAANSSVPVQAIAAGSGVTAVAGGDGHTCAVVSGGVRCWGYNGSGQFGNGTATSSSVPVQSIAAGSGVTAVAAGSSMGYDTCAIVAGGVQCWGINWFGELGDGTTTSSLVPVQAIAAGSGVNGLAMGRFHTCAALSGGVRCWGDNSDGQLGNGTTANSSVPVQAIAAGSGVTAVTAGSHHTCAVVSGGVRCWGDNSSGQLGNNTIVNSSAPVQAIAAGSSVTALSVGGGSHTCAVVSGGLQCWGLNNWGQLGNGTTTNSLVPIQAIAAGTGVPAVAAGVVYSCAIVGNVLKCWGYNSSGQLGDGTTTSSSVPVQVISLLAPPVVVPPPVLLSNVSASQTTVIGTSNQSGTLHWVVVAAGSVVPSAAQIKARTNYAGVAVVASGSTPVSANVQASGSLSGLATNQDYVAYVVAADGSGNLSNIASATIARVAGTGSCGTASGAIPTYLAPSSNLCAAGGGIASAVTADGSNTRWAWTCTGTDAGSVASCSAPRGYNVTVVIESNPPGANGTVNPIGTTLRVAGSPVFVSTNIRDGSTFTPIYRGCGPGTIINSLYYSTANLSADCIVYVSFVQKASNDPPALCGVTAGSCTRGTVSNLVTGTTGSTWTCNNGSNIIGCSAANSCAANAGIRLVGVTSNASNTSLNVDRCDGSNATQSVKPIGLAAASGTLYVGTCTSGLNTYTITSNSSPVVFTGLPPNTRFSCKVEEQVGGVTVSTSQSVIIDTAPTVLRPQPDVVRVWRDTPTRIDVLRNDWLSNGGVADGMGAYTQPANGTLTAVSIGGEIPQLLYTPNAGYVGQDSFSYQAQDLRSGTLGASTPVAITVLAPFPLPATAGTTATTTLAVDGAGSVDVTVTSNGVASGATQPTLRVTGYSRSGGSNSGLSARTTGRTLVSEFSTAVVSDQLVFDQAEPDLTGTLDARSYRQSATADGDIVLEPINKSIILPESRLISAVGDILFTSARRVPYAPFWRGLSSTAAASFIDGTVASADALPDTPGKYLQEMLSSHALGIAPEPTSFAALPAGSIALGVTGDFSATDVMIGDGDKRVGLISQLQGHSVYGNRLQGPEMIGALNRLVDGATLITGTWASVSALSGVTLSQVHQSLMSAYRTHGHRRGFANLVRYVREVNTAALDTTTQSIRTRLLAELSADEYFTLPGGVTLSAPLSDVTAVISAGMAADQIAMHLLKVGAQNELLRQLLDADGAKLLLQDLLVEMLAQGPYSANFLRYLPTMKVYTMERYLNTAFSPAQLQFRLQQTTGAARYAQLLGIGRNQ